LLKRTGRLFFFQSGLGIDWFYLAGKNFQDSLISRKYYLMFRHWQFNWKSPGRNCDPKFTKGKISGVQTVKKVGFAKIQPKMPKKDFWKKTGDVTLKTRRTPF